MLLHCKSPIKETVAQTAEALFTRVGTILAELSFFVEACDVCGSVVSSNKENIIQAIGAERGSDLRLDAQNCYFILLSPKIEPFLCTLSRVSSSVLPFIQASRNRRFESESWDALAAPVDGNIPGSIRPSNGN